MDAAKLKYNIKVEEDICGDFIITIPLYMINDKKCEVKIISKENKK